MAYPGGKSGDGVFQKIINQIPPHDVYIEAFSGSASIRRIMRPSSVSVLIDLDPAVCRRLQDSLPGSIVICGDAISILSDLVFQYQEKDKSVFVYCDPPYLADVRKSSRPLYAYEMMDPSSHSALLSVLQSLSCMVAVSGYYSPLYNTLLSDWRSLSFNAATRSGVAVEWLWMNYPVPSRLHDYSFLGDNFREREKISKQKKRWRDRLLRMSPLQRYALLSSISDLDDL